MARRICPAMYDNRAVSSIPWPFSGIGRGRDRPSNDAGTGSTNAADGVPDGHESSGIVGTGRRDCRGHYCLDRGPDGRSPARRASIVAARWGLPGPQSIADGALMSGSEAERVLASRYHCANACARRRTSDRRRGVRRHGRAGVRIAHSVLWRVGNGSSRKAGASRWDRTSVVRGGSAWRILESFAVRTKGENAGLAMLWPGQTTLPVPVSQSGSSAAP